MNKTNGALKNGTAQARPAPKTGAFVALPAQVEAEEALLGALLIDEDRILDVNYLSAEDFYLGKHKLIYEAILNLISAGARVDLVSVAAELERRGQVAAIGGPATLSDLCSQVGFTYNAPHYAAIVYRESVRRKVIESATAIVEETYKTEEVSPDAILAQALARLNTVEADRSLGGPRPIRAGVEKFLDKAENAKETKNAGLSTGIRDLDKLLGGLQKSKLYLLAGRPGMGKSGLAIGIMRHLAKEGKRILYFSLEMPEEDVVGRLVSQEAGVAFDRLYSGELTGEEWTRVASAVDDVARFPIVVDDQPLLRFASLKARAMREALRGGVDLIVVDHFGLARSDRTRRASQYEEASDIADGALELAKTLHVPVLGLVQLSRSVEHRNKSDRRPTLGDLRDSGKWEENADAVLFVYQDWIYNPDTELPNIGELVLAKNRGGRTGSASVYWKAERMQYMPLELRTIDL